MGKENQKNLGIVEMIISRNGFLNVYLNHVPNCVSGHYDECSSTVSGNAQLLNLKAQISDGLKMIAEQLQSVHS